MYLKKYLIFRLEIIIRAKKKILKKNLDTAKKLNEELKKRCVDLQNQCDQSECEITKLK